MGFKVRRRCAMRKWTVALMVASLILGGISFAVAADEPQALNGVNLSDAQKVTDTEAQDIRGTALGPNPTSGDGIHDHCGWDDGGPGPYIPSR